MTLAGILALVTLVAAVLQIILFFKVWAMTNDVKQLRAKYAAPNGNSFKAEIRRLLCSGDKGKAKELLINRFYDTTGKLDYSDFDKSTDPHDEDKKKLDKAFLKAKAELSRDLAKIGYPLPEAIEQMKSGQDFFDLF